MAVSDSSVTTADFRGRAAAFKLAETNPREALKVARAIRHPWYRCQALAGLAQVWGTKAQQMDVLEEALAGAQEQSEINRIVTVSSWPLGVMVRLDSDAVTGQLIKHHGESRQKRVFLRRLSEK